VIIPAHNEGERIAATVAAARRLPGVCQVIVVDDGSSDDTAPRAASAGAEVMRLERRMGKGGAVQAGLSTARGEIVLLLDADLGASAAQAHRLIAPVACGGAEMTIAVFPQVRQRGGFGLAVGLARLAIRALTWRRMEAPLSGQRAVRHDLLERLCLAPGFALETALTLDALALGARLVEVPVEMTHAATGRSLAGFLHRGRQFAAVLAAALPRLFWPLGPTGRPAGRARAVAWALALALVIGCAWPLGPRASAAVLTFAWVLWAIVASVALAQGLGWQRENYLGRRLPSSVGVGFALASLPLFALLDGSGTWQIATVALALVTGGVGLLDDLVGSGDSRGFAGHLGQLARRRITTGVVKLALGGGACLATGLMLAGWQPWPGLLDGLVIALCANAINLLDLRPGRALKGFWALCALALAFRPEVVLILGPLLIASVIYAPLDFGARAMMGDAGANPLGAVAGLALVVALPVAGRIAAAAALVALHAYAEVASLSGLIERSSALRWLDRLGRPSPQEPEGPEAAQQ